MREIKFRAWDKKEKRYWSQDEMNEIGGYYYTFGVSDSDGDFALCQFTGLKDKNGKEIYEGDIVKQDETYVREPSGRKSYEVKFKEGCFSAWPYGNWPNFCEVIGNIYENPELLTN